MRLNLPLSHFLSCIAILAIPWGCGSELEQPSETSRLVVSQILYRNIEDTLEWIELRNDGEGPVDLSGIQIKGADFEFPDRAGSLAPGGRIVLTNSEALFARHHPGRAIGGILKGRLADEGERIRVVSRDGTLFEFAYEAWEPWPVAAARFGSSLVYRGSDPSDPRSWSASLAPGGSPLSDPPIATEATVWISEIRPADDLGNGFIELANGGTDTVDISGWILAPEAGGNRYDTLGAGTRIAPGGRLALRQSPQGGGPGWGRQSPKSTEDAIFLLDRTGGTAHSLAWTFIPPGMSVARLSPGEESGQPVLISDPTPGAEDKFRSVGPVAISEICFQPSTGEAEFVELENGTDSTVHLGHPSDTLRSWRISGTGASFSSEDSILPHGRFLVVNRAETTPQAFRARWSVPQQVPIQGFPGRLDDAGETLELRLPRVASAKQGERWLEEVVDAATWRPHRPWPSSVRGGGDCLVRTDKRIPGTSPLAWLAAEPTPGR